MFTRLLDRLCRKLNNQASVNKMMLTNFERFGHIRRGQPWNDPHASDSHKSWETFSLCVRQLNVTLSVWVWETWVYQSSLTNATSLPIPHNLCSIHPKWRIFSVWLSTNTKYTALNWTEQAHYIQGSSSRWLIIQNVSPQTDDTSDSYKATHLGVGQSNK